ncbi:hypothetical protein PINS_up009459 [Pythium insidiosum]|nr:hypothetical protein PINS_up009459 [Pythium insidiosum]
MCIEQIKLAMFGKSLWIRGLNAFLGNMVQRFDVGDDKTYVSGTCCYLRLCELNELSTSLFPCSEFWLTDYINGCSHRIFEAALPSFLFSMPTFRSLAILIYREVGVPLIGIRTLQENVQIYPVDKDMNEIGFHSVFFLSKSRDTISKIERLQSSVFGRHSDISPNIDLPSKSTRSFPQVFTNPFQRLSVALASDTTRGSLASIPRTSMGAHAARSMDKITPLSRDDDFGDSATFDRSTAPTTLDIKAALTDSNASITRHPSSIRDDDMVGDIATPPSEDPPFTPPHLPVVAFSPADLIKKATTPVTPRRGLPPVSPRSPSKTPVGSPRTQMKVTPRTQESPRSSRPEVNEVEPGPPPELPSLSTTHDLGIETVAEGDADSDDDASEKNDVAPPQPVTQKEGSPLLRRAVNVIAQKRRQSRHPRASQYRSFKRKAPPKDLADHFVVCGVPSSYSDLLASLGDLNERTTPVVFVTPRDLSEKDFLTYVQNKDVFFVRGSPVSMRVFDEARMYYARGILILAFCGGGQIDQSGANTDYDENMADVDAITTHRFISEACQNFAIRKGDDVGPKPSMRPRSSLQPMNRWPYIVVEMMRPSNAKFLIDRSGSLYDERNADNERRTHDLLKETHAIDDSLFSPMYAGGHIFFSNFVDALLGSTSQSPCLIDMMTQLVNSGNISMSLPDRDSRSKQRLSQMPVPARYHNRPYALLVEGLLVNDVSFTYGSFQLGEHTDPLLCKQNIMALGIYRAGHSSISPSFVFTNPVPNEIVNPHDLVFVIK